MCGCLWHTYISGTLYGMQVCATDELALRDGMRRLADLIDPTCHPVPSDGGFFTCSECGERIGAVLPALGTVLMHHCSHCGLWDSEGYIISGACHLFNDDGLISHTRSNDFCSYWIPR